MKYLRWLLIGIGAAIVVANVLFQHPIISFPVDLAAAGAIIVVAIVFHFIEKQDD